MSESATLVELVERRLSDFCAARREQLAEIGGGGHDGRPSDEYAIT